MRTRRLSRTVPVAKLVRSLATGEVYWDMPKAPRWLVVSSRGRFTVDVMVPYPEGDVLPLKPVWTGVP